MQSRGEAVTALLDLLERSPSGMRFVQDCLAAAMTTWGLDDVVLVIDDPADGRQWITPDGKPPDPSLLERVDDDEAGLIAVPELPASSPVPWALLHVARIALRLDRDGWSSTVDTATGLFNAPGFRRQVARVRERHEHGGSPFALAAIDVVEGAALDERASADVVARLGAAVAATLRRGDSGARTAPHRFAVVLDGADRADARRYLGRLRDVVTQDAVLSTVNLRIGVASCPEDGLDLSGIIGTASLRLDEGEVRLVAVPARPIELVSDEFDLSRLRPEAIARRRLAVDVPGDGDAGTHRHEVVATELPSRHRFG